MNPEKQRIKIAEACGWKGISPEYLTGYAPWRPTPYGERVMGDLESIPLDPLPDYLNDLNAMHEAEETLPEEKRPDYVNNLYLVAIAHQARTGKWRYSSLSASQRAEVFLKTLNLWEDNA